MSERGPGNPEPASNQARIGPRVRALLRGRSERETMRTPRKTLLPLAVTVAIILGSGAAQALPGGGPPPAPDPTHMVNGPVRSIVRVGDLIWVAGKFTSVLDGSASPVASVNNIAAFDDGTGALDTMVHIPSVTSTTTAVPIIYDMSLAPDGTTIYFIGTFNSVDGDPRSNVGAFDGTTGALLPFSATASSTSKSVYASATRVFIGGKKLKSFNLDGTVDTSFATVTAGIDSTVRARVTDPSFRDITPAGTNLLVACQCDILDGNEAKAIALIDAATGTVENWPGSTTSHPTNFDSKSGAFGIAVLATGSTYDLAAGGSDFVASYNATTGALLWFEDTSGSSQAIVMYGSRLVIGGHFDWVEQGTSGGCGTNSNPNSLCLRQPRLAALDPATGAPDTSWTPGICCLYNGVWTLLSDPNGTTPMMLHVGGEFTKAGGKWKFSATLGKWILTKACVREYYARFTEGSSATCP